MRNSSSLSKAIGATAVGAGALIACNVAALMGEAIAQAAAAVLGAAALGAAALLLLRTGRAVRQATAVCRAVSDGDFEARVVGIEAGGDIGRLVSAINDLIDRSDAYVRESAAAMQAVRANTFFRKIREEGLHGGLLRAARIINEAMASIESRLKALEAETTVFEGSIHGIVESVATASGAMGETAASLSGGAGETVTRAAGVGSAIEQATANIQSIAAACTELTSSAKEVGHQVDRSAELTRKTVTRAAEAEHTIKTMSRAGQNIAEVAGLIRSIAAQTNLLALNATIEAARAGEAGKGFAVVAQEVKSLALQTARATGEIDTHISEVQGATQAAVAAISEIGGMVLEVDQGTAGLAETMRAQVLATNEIAGNIEQAFAGFRDISGNIRAVTANAGETERLAAGTRDASTRLAQQSQRLAEEARRFIVALRTGPLGRSAEAAAAADQPPQAAARPGARPALKLVAA